MNFWDVIKEVSAQGIRREAESVFVLALAGEASAVARARGEVLGPATAAEAEQAAPYLLCVSPPYTPEDGTRLRHCDLLVSLPGGPGLTDYRFSDTLQVDDIASLRLRVLERRPDLLIRLSRRLPGFRAPAADQVIGDISRVNAEFAAVSGIGQSIPALLPFFPAVAGADLLVLTKNQVMMIFRLAAIYGEDLSVRARLREVAAVIGGAFGWRTLARMLLGVLPGPLGLPVRAGVAFAGTYAAGRGAQVLFDEGRRATRAEMRRFYEEGARLARETVERIRTRLRRERPGALPEGEPPPVPPAAPEPAEVARER